MAENLILTVAHGPMCDGDGYRVFLKSFAANAKNFPETKLLIFSGEMSATAQKFTKDMGAVLSLVPANFRDSGNKQRHWYFAQHLAEHRGEYECVVTVDSRDTIFQASPFTLEKSGKILFSAESGPVNADPWNKKDQAQFQHAIRTQCRADTMNYQVINGGFVAGGGSAMADFQLLRFAIDARDGAGTDQASLTALAYWLRGFPGYKIIGDDEPWIFHGHWCGKSKNAIIDEHGTARLRSTGEPYKLFHQYDRTFAEDVILKRYA